MVLRLVYCAIFLGRLFCPLSAADKRLPVSVGCDVMLASEQ